MAAVVERRVEEEENKSAGGGVMVPLPAPVGLARISSCCCILFILVGGLCCGLLCIYVKSGAGRVEGGNGGGREGRGQSIVAGGEAGAESASYPCLGMIRKHRWSRWIKGALLGVVGGDRDTTLTFNKLFYACERVCCISGEEGGRRGKGKGIYKYVQKGNFKVRHFDASIFLLAHDKGHTSLDG